MRALLLSVVVLGGCNSVDDLLTGSDCTETVENTIDVNEPAPPNMQLKVDQCRVDVDACANLCNGVLAGTGAQTQVPAFGDGAPFGFSSGNLFTKCEVTFEGATAHVDVAYEQFNGGPNCPVFDNAGGGMP